MKSKSFKQEVIEEYGESIAEELFSLGVDNSFKLELIKNANIDNDNSLISLAYPNHSEKFFGNQYDLEKWNKLKKNVTMMKRSGFSEDKIEEAISKSINDEEEKYKFKNWSNIKMEQKKYSNKDPIEDYIEKNALWMSGITPGSTYSGDVNEGYSSYDSDPNVLKAKEIKNDKGRKMEVRVRRLLNGMMKSLQEMDMPYESYEQAAQNIFDLMGIFKKQFSKKTLADATYRTSNSLKKLGLDNHSEELRKFSQELEAEQGAPQPEQVATPEAAVPEGEAAPVQPAEAKTPEEKKEDEVLKKMDESESFDVRKIKTPGPEEGEYSDLVNPNLQLEDAAQKLDDVASMLADRRVIRMLAEFDIMLDQLGIASMFPELAESQSKLIDAFSYALTRVSKMMGQISNAKTLMGASDTIPGSDVKKEAPEVAPLPEAPVEQPAPE
jgi:hypothetical protein